MRESRLKLEELTVRKPRKKFELVSSPDGDATIEAVGASTFLSLRRAGTQYRVETRAGDDEIVRCFPDWCSAALAFAMLYHTEQCLDRLGGHV